MRGGTCARVVAARASCGEGHPRGTKLPESCGATLDGRAGGVIDPRDGARVMPWATGGGYRWRLAPADRAAPRTTRGSRRSARVTVALEQDTRGSALTHPRVIFDPAGRDRVQQRRPADSCVCKVCVKRQWAVGSGQGAVTRSPTADVGVMTTMQKGGTEDDHDGDTITAGARRARSPMHRRSGAESSSSTSRWTIVDHHGSRDCTCGNQLPCWCRR